MQRISGDMAHRRDDSPAIASFLVTVMATLALAADINVNIREEEREATFVANVSDYPALFWGVASASRQNLVYNILDKSSFPASFFKIDAGSGVISMATRVDREQVCRSNGECGLEFNVAIQGASGVSFSNIAAVKVTVLDINDNAPSFPARQVYLKVSEGAKVGTVLQLSGAQDLDSNPKYIIQRYEVTPKNNVFSISSTRNPDGSSFINLRLELGLDREAASEYNFDIVAYDGGDPQLNDSLKVDIQVDDVNDNPPVFEQESYSVEIREDAPVGSRILQVRAADRDSGVFGAVRYRFSSLRSEVVDRFFALNSSTGDITLKSQLEHKTGVSEYNVIVEASDGGTPPFVVQAVVTIKVLNTGNNPPVVRIVTVLNGDTSEVQLPESAVKDSFVAFVNVEDSDVSQNGNVSCSMNSTLEFRLDKLPNKGYKIVLNRNVDREVTPAYTLAISCADMGSPPLTTTVTCGVIITDINDNAPTFDLTSYRVTVDENNSPGQYLLQVTASDKDAGVNALLKYGFLEAGASQFLHVDSQTGLITATLSLDREATPELRYTLTATDAGTPQLSGTAALTIIVGDANDNAPQFQGLPYLFSVSERAERGFLVGHITAMDVDAGRNGEVELFFAGSVNGEVPFTVSSDGSVTVFRELDRETDPLYVFTVLARDRGSIPMSNTTQVTIKITDVNDNPPVILFPTNVNHSVVVSSQPEDGTVLARVIAYDVDDGSAASLVFSIASGNDDGVFQVESKSGEVSLRAVHKLRNPHVYQLLLRVSDLGVPALSATTSLLVEVSFQNLSSALDGVGGWEGESSHDSYVVIVGVIGGVTLVLSGIIIGAILFVLRSERHRKPPKHCPPRSGCPVFKNDYVTPKAESSPVKKIEAQREGSVPRQATQGDRPSSPAVILSPKSLGQKPDAHKKVSFSLDQPDADVMLLQGRALSLPPPPPLPPPPSVHDVAVDGCLWKRMSGPDDVNSDASGESGTSDSGKGASDDDTHLDISLDKHAGNRGHPALNSFRPSPATAEPYSTATLTFGSGRQVQSQPEHHLRGQRSSSGAKPRFAQSGSYQEGRRSAQGAKGSGHPYRRNHATPLYGHPAQAGGYMDPSTGSRHSLDLMDNVVSRAPARAASSLSYQRQTSGGGGPDDDVSTTTSGSYTVNPDEFRLDGVMSHDVIV